MKKLSGIQKAFQISNCLQINIRGNQQKYSLNIDDWKTFVKNNLLIALNIFIWKKKKYVQLTFQKSIRIIKNK